jgi:outer membrane protein assembly factor BamB
MHRTHAAPDRSLLIVGFGSQVFALDRATGAVRWEVGIDGGDKLRTVEVLVADGVVIAANASELVFLDYASGHVHARVAIAHTQLRPVMLLDGDHLFVTGEGAVSCYTLRGHRVWTQPFDGKRSWGQRAPVALAVPGHARQADER